MYSNWYMVLVLHLLAANRVRGTPTLLAASRIIGMLLIEINRKQTVHPVGTIALLHYTAQSTKH
jgi:hypothetical protein